MKIFPMCFQCLQYSVNHIPWDEDRFCVAILQNQLWSDIERYLLNKYQRKMENLGKKILSKFPCIAVYSEDLSSFQYLSLKKVLNVFHFQWKFKFIQFYTQSYKFMVQDYLKKLSNNNYKLLNYAVRGNDFHGLQLQQADKMDIAGDFRIKTIIKAVLHGKEKLSNFEKIILNKKIDGYSNLAIATELKVSPKRVDNAYFRALAKLKRNYWMLDKK